MPRNELSNTGSFVPLTNIWDVQRLQQVEVTSPEFKELLVRLYQNINNICLSLNLKDTGYYTLSEFMNSQLYFPDPALSSTTAQTPMYRQVFRTVVDFGALPNAGAKSVAHNIPIDPATPTTYSFTRIYAAASNGTAQNSFIPIPFASPVLNENIKLEVTDTDVIITTGIDRTSYTQCYVVLEYLKQ